MSSNMNLRSPPVPNVRVWPRAPPFLKVTVRLSRSPTELNCQVWLKAVKPARFCTLMKGVLLREPDTCCAVKVMEYEALGRKPIKRLRRHSGLGPTTTALKSSDPRIPHEVT